MELIQEVQANLVNYKTLLEPTEASAIRIIKDNPDKKITISVVIPVRGRQRMHEPVVKYFAAAMEYNQDVQVDIIIVEHSQHQEHAWIAAKMGIANYVWLPSKSNEPFNKCLCHNVGAVVCQADYYLFHDIDTLVPEDFFTRLLENWKNQSAHGAGALQCFTKRRLLHCNKSLTDFILDDVAVVKSFSVSNKDVTAAKFGAQGGSIFIPKGTFVHIGGYDDCLYSDYSVEDAAFFHKIELLTSIGFCDDPPIELLHLEHPAHRVTKESDLRNYKTFRALPDEVKFEIMKLQSDNLAKFIPIEGRIFIPEYVQGVLNTIDSCYDALMPDEKEKERVWYLDVAAMLLGEKKIRGNILFNTEKGVFYYANQ